ncbi:hypothetical protein S7711_01751 [Stachybotrys chartarum IBT 7711]|uniref:Proteasome component ECM29 n=1 Tax=Stachybotrys chartarum (strain CBS 109288 / IBT 7711) TaxID=1280523 RepID=A0A084AVH2_STACB|nr:hypothetical protein S7711_01751 [Stachybotrys chartarum IBT 7711]KFA76086.1 hypothetical protein S40288_00310 [Stachybotrys chartarum IBT 40288]
MAAASTEQRELQLVESVDFRILAVANNEEKLQQILQRYLAPLILKAASEYRSVSTKVIEILVRLKTFIKAPQIILPMVALLEQYKTQSSPVVKHLDLSFLQHSLERIDDHERRELIPKALRGFSQDEGQTRAGPMFHIILRLLLDARLPPRGSKDDEGYRAAIGLEDDADAKYLANRIGLFLRLRTPAGGKTWAAANPTLSAEELQSLSLDSLESQTILRRWSEVKAKLVAFLASGALTDDEKFLPALYAASNLDKRVASAAEEIVKRSSVSVEEPAIVKSLFHAHSQLPAAYRIRILGLLSKSASSATMPDEILKVVSLNLAGNNSEDGPESNFAPSSYLERQKLITALFQYISWVARISPSKEKLAIGPKLIGDMMSHIKSEGWPTPSHPSQEQAVLRSKAYETIGLVARSADWSVQERVDLAAWLFRSLSEDPTHEAVVNIDGALSSLTSIVPPQVGGEDETLRRLLLTYMLLPDEPPAVRSTRHAVVKWANQCLPFSNIHARWIDILAIAGRLDERGDVTEQGQKGLDPWTYFAHSEEDSTLPDWKAMTLTFLGTSIEPNTDAMSLDKPDPGNAVPVSTIFQNFQGSSLSAFPVAIRYIKHIMLLTALEGFKVEPDWMQTLEARIKTDIGIRDQVRKYLRTADSGYVVFYLNACLEGAFVEDVSVAEEAVRCFVDIASLCSINHIGYLKRHTARLFGLLKSHNKEVRALVSRALGILASHPAQDLDDIKAWRADLPWDLDSTLATHGTASNAAEGGLLALGYTCSRSVYYNHFPPNHDAYPLSFLIDSRVPNSLYEVAVESFSQLWTAGLATPPDTGNSSLEKIIDKLKKSAKKGNEKAIFALGRLAVCIEQEETAEGSVLSEGALGNILQELFGLHEIKQVEIHFTIGEALAAVASRWDSNAIKLELDVEPGTSSFRKPTRSAVLKAVLDKLFQDCKATKPSLLKASGVWLFCIVQYCSHLDQVQSRLREAQSAFMRLLAARDDLVQETASRGLSLVYERGDPDLKATLVKDLVATFTGTGTQLKVEQETELFEPGALPTGDGSSVTSYKDIVNLANEVGDQRLVYKFMSLAANAATWSTRSAFGRFGLSNILLDSEIEDPKLYPKLFRYRFDPNKNVQRSMDDIWKALVKDPGAVLETHFDAILDDLLKSILGREWRMREASCAALSDLLQGRPFSKYEKRYGDIWTSALKVLDDVKGSVRAAASSLCFSLSKGLVRQLEESPNGSAAKAMMKEALPFLLSDKGIDNSVQEVRLFSTSTVLQITKEGGEGLRSFIPIMVPQLLGLLSTLEPQEVNYYYQRMADDRRDEIDRLRSQAVNQSPISEAIDNLLRFVDAEVMAELAPGLEAAVKTALALPTKVGCSRVLNTLFTRHAQDIKPVSGRFLKLMEKQILDKNDEVSQAYARTTAYMMRVVSDSVKETFWEKLITMYFQSEEELRRQRIAVVVVSLAKISPDYFTAQENQLLPFAYLGSHDPNDHTSEVFREAWDQHAGSSRTVARYVPEIVVLVERCMDTAQWALRHAGALTVAAMIKDVVKASDATGEINAANQQAIWPVLEKTLALKTFDGKAKLLESFHEFVDKSPSLWENDPKIATTMRKITIREAKRNNEAYKVQGFESLWKFAKARKDLDMFEDIVEIVTPSLDQLTDAESGDKMDIDSKEDTAPKVAKRGVEAVSRGYNRASMNKQPVDVLGNIIRVLGPYLSSSHYDSIKREVWYDCVIDIMSDATANKAAEKPASNKELEDVWSGYVSSLGLDAAESGTEPQRVKRANATLALVKAMKQGVFGALEADMGQFDQKIAAVITEERSLEVQRAWRQVLELLRG